jgi:A/G-specific adenine glycosylase
VILARYTPPVPAVSARTLLRWFRATCRDLPWRGPFPRDPYRVLVSEVLAQQTQVDRAAVVFRRFVDRFPSIEALAAADVEDVVQEFTGLGYYRRARLLHAAARAIVARGAWPSDYEELAALPGLGPYTAAGVSAFAFGGDTPPVDGNIARVTARVRALALRLGSRELLRAGHALAGEMYAAVKTPEVWEALMELGATVCTPAAPRCPACPLRAGCGARRAGSPDAFPLPRKARAREKQRWAALWLARPDGSVLLQRVDAPLLAGLWLPPFAVMRDGEQPEAAARALAEGAGFTVTLRPGPTIRHALTHRDILVSAFLGTVRAARVGEAADGWSWQDPHRPRVATSSLLAKLARACAGRTEQEG